jgi:hypothetical protein
MQSTIRLKYWFFAHYWWILSATALATAVLLAVLRESPASFAGALGAILSVVYFVQKQKLEEMRLFREIFKECNARYDAMNESLAKVCGSNDARLTPEESDLLIDYFNLCGEECLYYLQGYIPPSVWQSWHLGMQVVISSPRVNELWRTEKATGSYYGLPLEPFKYAPSN